MKQVTMNYRVFDQIHPYQYVAPTIGWLSGWTLNEFEIKDLEVTFQLDYNRGEYRVQIIDTASNMVMVDYTEKLPCAVTGEQKNIDSVMGLLKEALAKDRHVQVQTAVSQFTTWFDTKVSKWLIVEAGRSRMSVKADREFCETVVIGYEVL